MQAFGTHKCFSAPPLISDKTKYLAAIRGQTSIPYTSQQHTRFTTNLYDICCLPPWIKKMTKLQAARLWSFPFMSEMPLVAFAYHNTKPESKLPTKITFDFTKLNHRQHAFTSPTISPNYITPSRYEPGEAR